MNCEICKKPLDDYALSRTDTPEPSGYCTDCTRVDGSLFEVLNYFHFSLQIDPIEFTINGKFRSFPWPHVKNPAVWHEKACLHFPGWRQIVSEFKSYLSIRYFDVYALRSLISLLYDSGMTAEEICIMRRSEVLGKIRGEAMMRQLTTQKENVVEELIHVSISAQSNA